MDLFPLPCSTTNPLGIVLESIPTIDNISYSTHISDYSNHQSITLFGHKIATAVLKEETGVQQSNPDTKITQHFLTNNSAEEFIGENIQDSLDVNVLEPNIDGASTSKKRTRLQKIVPLPFEEVVYIFNKFIRGYSLVVMFAVLRIPIG